MHIICVCVYYACIIYSLLNFNYLFNIYVFVIIKFLVFKLLFFWLMAKHRTIALVYCWSTHCLNHRRWLHFQKLCWEKDWHFHWGKIMVLQILLWDYQKSSYLAQDHILWYCEIIRNLHMLPKTIFFGIVR